MKHLTVDILKDLAKQGKVPSIVIEDNEFNSSIAKTNWFLRHDENKIVNFHYNSTILMWDEHALGLSFVSKLQNMFEEAYQGFHLAIESFTKTQCILVIKKNDIESLKISDDYKLATEKMEEIKKELLDRIDNGFVYLSVGFGNHHLYYYSETGYMEKGHSKKGYFGYLPNAFDNEYDYFKDQLTAYKLYKISDIVMDNALRNTDSVQEYGL